jgi:hypothetical protein
VNQREIWEFQTRFRRWLGSEPERGAEVVARLSGYSADYVRWAAGLIGKRKWPGSRRFVSRMEELGCTDKPWRDRSAGELRRAFEHREVLKRGEQCLR